MATNSIEQTEPGLIDKLLHSLARIEDPAACGQDDILTALSFAARIKQVAKELSDKVEQSAIGYITLNGPFESGTTRYYVGQNKTTKCTDPTGTLKAVLEATGGDVDKTAEYLSSGCWKYGALKPVLGDAWGVLFKTDTVADLKTGEAKPARLQVVNDEYKR